MRKIEKRPKKSNRAQWLQEKHKSRKTLGISSSWDSGQERWYEITYWYVGFKPKTYRESNRYGGYNHYYMMDGEERLHRENGPAITSKSGKADEWYIYGIRLEAEDFTSIEMVKKMKAWSRLTPVQLAALKNKTSEKSN